MGFRGKIFVFFVLVLALALITPAFAGDREKLGDAWWTGPLETSNPNTIPKNHIYIETYFAVEQDHGGYNSHGNLVKTGQPLANDYQSTTLFQYGITNNFNIGILLGFDAPQGGTHMPDVLMCGKPNCGFEVGLLKIRPVYRFLKYKEGKWWPAMSVASGFIAPTTSYSTFTPFIALWEQRPFWMPGGRILRVRANEEVYHPMGKDYGPLDCSVLGPAAAACNINGHNYYKALLGMEYSLTKKWVPAWDFYYRWGDRTNYSTTGPVTTGVYSASTNRLVIDPALEYNFTENTGIIFGAEMTINGRNVGSYIAPQIALQWFK